MSLDGLMVHDVTILRATSTTDRYGNAQKSWVAPARTSVRGWVSQQSRSEVVDGREAQVSDWVCYLPTGTVITGHDRVLWESVTFELAGPVNPAWSPRIRGVHHLEVALRVVAG